MWLSCVVLSVCCSCGLAACATPVDRSAAEDFDAIPIASEYFASEYGVRVGVRIGFSEDRRLTGARLVWGEESEEVALYPLDGTDPEPPPKTLDLPQGVEVLLEGSVVAACPDAPALPLFEVQTVRRGEEITERYTPNEASRFVEAFQEWCGLPFMVTLTGSRKTPEGECTYWLRLHNPGPSTVVVVSEEVSGGPWVWESARAAVPAGTIGSVTIRGHGDPPTAPWESGHLLADGRPIVPGGGAATATVSGDLC
jgi:hypothetical protein